MQSCLYANIGQAASLSRITNRLVKYCPFFLHLTECAYRLPQFYLDSQSIINCQQRGVAVFVQPGSVFLNIHKSKSFDLILAVVDTAGRITLHVCLYITPNPSRYLALRDYTHTEYIRKFFSEMRDTYAHFKSVHTFSDEYITGDLNIDMASGTGWGGEILQWFQSRSFISCMPGFTHRYKKSSSKIDVCYIKTETKFGFHRVDSVEGKQGHDGVYVYPVRFDEVVRIETFDTDKYIDFLNENPILLPCVQAREKVDIFYSELFDIAKPYKTVKLVKGTPSSKYDHDVRVDFDSVVDWEQGDVKQLMARFGSHMDGKRNFFDFCRTFLLGDSRIDERTADAEKVQAFCTRQGEKNSLVRVAKDPDCVYPDPFDPWRCEEQADAYYKRKMFLTPQRVKRMLKDLTDSDALQYKLHLSNSIAKRCTGLHAAFCSILNSIVAECEFPALLKISRVQPVPKKGKDFANSRPVSILGVICKLFEVMLLEFITPIVDHKLPPGMIAYRRDSSTFLGLILVDDAIMNVVARDRRALVLLRDAELESTKIGWYIKRVFHCFDCFSYYFLRRISVRQP